MVLLNRVESNNFLDAEELTTDKHKRTKIFLSEFNCVNLWFNFWGKKFMCCKNYWKRIVPFVLTLILGLLAGSLLRKENFNNKNQENTMPLNKIVYRDKEGTGTASCSHSQIKSDASINIKSLERLRSETGKLQIISKPLARFTDNARRNETEGSVRLRVVFTASGQIGNVVPVSGLPDGLTEQAMVAARQIKFEPATRNNKPITVTKIVEYNFTIY